MAQNANEIVVAGKGDVHVAPYGTSLPGETAVFDTLDAAFVTVGFTTEDGVEFSDGINVTDLMAWQSLYPVRRLVESYESSVKFTALQWNWEVFEQLFVGVVSEEVADTVHKFTPTRDGTVAEKTLVVDFEDGSYDYRFVIPRVGQAAALTMNLVRTDAAEIPTEWGVIGGDAAGEWYMLTDDPAFDISG